MSAEGAQHGWSLGERFVEAARKNWHRRCISDSAGKKLSYGQTLVSAIALAAKIGELTDGQEKVGILLPPSTGGALANLAVTMLGKVAVNLNYVVSDQARESAVSQCGIRCVFTSRSFAERIGNLDHLPGLVFLEDIAEKIELAAKMKAYLKARFMPRRLFGVVRRPGGNDLAAVIFSSGATGEPKGVMLSHNNILSNIEALRSVFQLKPDDNLCGVLPFFHSFGFTCSLWLPVVSGVSASYAANPLDGRLVGKIARESRSTILFAVPTFLSNYIKRTQRDDFHTLRAVVVGAEKLAKRLADSFEAKFDIRPQEGYGATELSPVVALNLAETQGTGRHRVGCKEGTVGLPIPGVEVKVVSLESGKEVATGQKGLLMVKGLSVMLGYLDREKETAEVLENGWYNTGDIASIDEEGFLTIEDRLSRFSKIGGEMVPHLGVEQVYLKALDTDEQVVAVTGVPHPEKGEELVVLHLGKAGGADQLHRIVSQSKLPNTWKPRPDNYVRIKAMPVLGSGKLHVVRLREIALAAKNT